MTQFPVHRTPAFLASYRRLPKRVRVLVDEKIELLSRNPAHRSLQAHKLRQVKSDTLWGCYVSINKRLLYQIKNGMIFLWDVGEHSIIDHIHRRRFE